MTCQSKVIDAMTGKWAHCREEAGHAFAHTDGFTTRADNPFPFRPPAVDYPAIGEALSLCERLYSLTGHRPTMVVLHPAHLPGYLDIMGLPVVRSEAAPKDRALVAWGLSR